jgi:hypothetical protein
MMSGRGLRMIGLCLTVILGLGSFACSSEEVSDSERAVDIDID